MKRIIHCLSFALLVILLQSCSGSDAYRGLWKATDGSGAKFEINFDAQKFSVKDSLGKLNLYEYKQHSVSIENSVKNYGIQLGDGRGYIINFPFSNNENTGFIKDGGGRIIYTISRTSYIREEDITNL